MKNSELLTHANQLNALINNAAKDKKEFPVKVSYAITRNLIVIQKELEPLERERMKLNDEYCEKDDNGEPTYRLFGKGNIQKDRQSEYTKKLTDLMEIDIPFEPHKISINDLPDSIEPCVLLTLDFMLE